MVRIALSVPLFVLGAIIGLFSVVAEIFTVVALVRLDIADVIRWQIVAAIVATVSAICFGIGSVILGERDVPA